MKDDILFDGPVRARALLILAHGSGQPMDSPFMAAISARIAANDDVAVRVARFNFPYMKRAVAEGRTRPPDRAPVLEAAWIDVIDSLRDEAASLFIGGKSLGGRFATMVADSAAVDGVICLGYPFHPPGRPERLRTAHLEAIATPVLICQGERDPFGGVDEVSGYALSNNVALQWMGDGDHGFKPRKSSGRTLEDNLDLAAAASVRFVAEIVKRS